jgi:uncharacterized protein YjbJ (UPF0337 family)
LGGLGLGGFGNNFGMTNTDDLKGRAKEAAGDLTNNDDLKREGQLDRATGKVKETADAVKDKVNDVLK